MFHGEKFSFGKTDVTRFEDTNLMLRKKIEPCLSNLLGCHVILTLFCLRFNYRKTNGMAKGSFTPSKSGSESEKIIMKEKTANIKKNSRFCWIRMNVNNSLQIIV